MISNIKYFFWVVKNFKVMWTFLPPYLRYFGPRKDWYDGPIYEFGLWYGHFYAMHKSWFEDEE